MNGVKKASTAAMLLWVLTGLFLGRVLGQIPVAFFNARFLPPMPEWYSGLLPYPVLLPIQIVLLVAMLKINRDISRGQSYFLTHRPRVGQCLFWFSILYAAGMLVRYFVAGSLHPERRWLPPGSIPIFFHWILAAYLFTLSHITLKQARKTQG